MADTATHLTWAFDEPEDIDRTILGGKGAGLCEMVALGLPVPPGFIIGTPAGREYLEQGRVPDALEAEIAERIAALEQAGGRRFGDDASPLLVSVRSGAPVSMPGMMDTVLNVGLTPDGAQALAAETGDEHFAWSSLERLLDGFATTVRGIGRGVVEDALLDVRGGERERCDALLALIAEEGDPFPDAHTQLREAIAAVFRSWTSRRAKAYRKHKGIDEAMGTACVVQLMVFGNRGEDSASGVAFTRDPSTGAPGAYGDVLFDAQGEDVVAGERDTLDLAELRERLPQVMDELEQVFSTLERSTRDLCDVEFTIEQGRLWVLQTRPGQRSGRAAVRVAVALCDEGLISREEAVGRVDDEQLEAARAPVLAGEPDQDAIVARGLAASPGAVSGTVCFDPDEAARQGDEDDPGTIILVRPTTAPADLPGVLASVGVVTGRGGRTSHAAVVARGIGRPAVCGAGELKIASDGASATLAGATLEHGETVTLDGDRGLVVRGELELTAAETDPVLARFLEWKG
jgi:pyruvate,orthophosphate dikinase